MQKLELTQPKPWSSSGIPIPGRESITTIIGKASAFTLLELLVVIAILGILAALLLPALSRSKQKAQGVYCLNNGKQLIAAIHMYAGDHNDWLPPNPEHGTNQSWVQGTMRLPTQATNTLFLTDPQYAKLAPYTGPGAAKLYRCPADSSTVTIAATRYPRVRTFSMSQAVGTKPLPPTSAVDAPWLDGKQGNRANNPWRTFGRFSDMVAPGPAGLWVLLDEDEYSINDAGFAVSMALPTGWIDVPGTYHNFACGVAFGDAHAEIHRWIDSRTRVGRNLDRRKQPFNSDILWLQKRTSSHIVTGEPQ